MQAGDRATGPEPGPVPDRRHAVPPPRDRRSRTGWRARARRTHAGALLLKAAALVLGSALIALGLALVVLPGPLTIPPVLLGLYVLSTEFAWADRLLDRAEASAREAWAGAKRRPLTSAVITIGGLVVAGTVLWVVGRFDVVARVREALTV